MKIMFAKLVREFAKDNDIPCSIIEGETHADLSISGLPIQFGLIESPGMILIQVPAGVVPREGRESFYTELLAANNLFSGTRGLTLGLDPKSSLVTLQVAWPLEKLDSDTFNTLVVNLLQGLGEWLKRQDGPGDGPAEEPSQPVDLSGAILV